MQSQRTPQEKKELLNSQIEIAPTAKASRSDATQTPELQGFHLGSQLIDN
ncbi:hypothetical protein NIES2100_22770 [Calothrix sp. NIES-2100]|nr:hypothetical protein NIES2100_22770 [Calothrix sp. NIES-2100]